MTQPTPPGDPDPTAAPTPPADPVPTPPSGPAPGDDQPLGPAGQKALEAERAARKELEKKLAGLAPLQQLADVISGGQTPPAGKSEVDLLNERFAAYEKDLADERSMRWRAEVAQAKGLTVEQAARLQGATREELAADADALLALFPAAPPGPRNPAPDPTQGARGGQPGPDLDAQIAAAKTKGDFWGAAALERSKLANIARPR